MHRKLSINNYMSYLLRTCFSNCLFVSKMDKICTYLMNIFSLIRRYNNFQFYYQFNFYTNPYESVFPLLPRDKYIVIYYIYCYILLIEKYITDSMLHHYLKVYVFIILRENCLYTVL